MSDLRDVCPDCLHDLRVHKGTLGLPITYPSLSYEALLKKVPRSSAEAGVRKVRASDLAGTKEQEKEREAPNSVDISKENVFTGSSEPPIRSSSSGEEEYTAESRAVPLQTARGLSIEDLFTRAYREMPDGDEGFEIGLTDVIRAVSDESVSLHFDLAWDGFDNPEIENRFRVKTPVSEERSIDAKELGERLSQVEKVATQRVITLKGAPGSGSAAKTENESHIQLPPEASKRERQLALLVDFAVRAVLTLIIAVPLTPKIFRDVSLAFPPNNFDVLAIVSAAILVFWPLSFFLSLLPRSPGQLLAGTRPGSLSDGSPPQLRERALRAALSPLGGAADRLLKLTSYKVYSSRTEEIRKPKACI